MRGFPLTCILASLMWSSSLTHIPVRVHSVVFLLMLCVCIHQSASATYPTELLEGASCKLVLSNIRIRLGSSHLTSVRTSYLSYESPQERRLSLLLSNFGIRLRVCVSIGLMKLFFFHQGLLTHQQLKPTGRAVSSFLPRSVGKTGTFTHHTPIPLAQRETVTTRAVKNL